MIRLFLIFTVAVGILSADQKMQRVVADYEKQKYSEVCNNGVNLYGSGYKNEAFLSIVGDACAKIDSIYAISQLQNSLIKTEQGRMNASYFATLVLQKKLIYQFFIDDLDLGHLVLPRTGHILSILFDNIIESKYTTISKEPKKIEFMDSERKIIAYTKPHKDIKKVVIDIYEDGQLIKSHSYW